MLVSMGTIAVVLGGGGRGLAVTLGEDRGRSVP